MSVEFVGNVDVGVVNGGNRSGGGCSCNNGAELVGVNSALAVWLWPVVVWVVFCECLLQDIAML